MSCCASLGLAQRASRKWGYLDAHADPTGERQKKSDKPRPKAQPPLSHDEKPTPLMMSRQHILLETAMGELPPLTKTILGRPIEENVRVDLSSIMTKTIRLHPSWIAFALAIDGLGGRS